MTKYYIQSVKGGKLAMIAFAVVLSCVCAGALGSKDRALSAPSYTEAKTLVQHTVEHMKLQAFTEGSAGIPYLNESRRHYLELLNVIDVAARGQLGCARLSYEDSYQRLLNRSAVEGISEPQRVQDKLKLFIEQAGQKIKYMVHMIGKFCTNITNTLCDNMIDILIQVDPSKYAEGAKLLLVAGKASKIYQRMAPEFVSTAVAFNVHRYVTVSEDKLKPLVFAVAELYRSLNVSSVSC